MRQRNRSSSTAHKDYIGYFSSPERPLVLWDNKRPNIIIVSRAGTTITLVFIYFSSFGSFFFSENGSHPNRA
ncbi:hypothetical protein FKM82_027539 [Ascaphus truei]